MTQILTAHEYFRKYLHKFNYDNSPDCPTFRRVQENAMHVFFTCPRFDVQRRKVESMTITPENLVRQMTRTTKNLYKYYK